MCVVPFPANAHRLFFSSDVKMPDIENAVINSTFCYIYFARDSFSDQQRVSVCEGFYKGDEIVTAKELLYDYSEVTLTGRRGNNRIPEVLNDILSLFRKI